MSFFQKAKPTKTQGAGERIIPESPGFCLDSGDYSWSPTTFEGAGIATPNVTPSSSFATCSPLIHCPFDASKMPWRCHQPSPRNPLHHSTSNCRHCTKNMRRDGLAILGFPCNRFLSQEPGTAGEIKEFCRVKYGVAFDLFAKIEVNGDGACDLYKYLTALDTKPVGAGKISWNFEKFIVLLWAAIAATIGFFVIEVPSSTVFGSFSSLGSLGHSFSFTQV
ncbi:MAG: hypothetical protein IT427_16065 [Pirellulales bacterium]|nr:hypothetical protein [Pirellulales bacterium]